MKKWHPQTFGRKTSFRRVRLGADQPFGRRVPLRPRFDNGYLGRDPEGLVFFSPHQLRRHPCAGDNPRFSRLIRGPSDALTCRSIPESKRRTCSRATLFRTFHERRKNGATTIGNWERRPRSRR